MTRTCFSGAGRLLLATALALSLPPAGGSAGDIPGSCSGTVSGMVISDAGLPLSGATITGLSFQCCGGAEPSGFLHPEERPELATAVSADDGRFTLSGLPCGRWYVSAHRGDQRLPESLAVDLEADTVQHLRLHLAPTQVLSGRVRSGGRSIAGVAVTAWAVLTGGSLVIAPRVAVGDDRGCFEISLLPAEATEAVVLLEAEGEFAVVRRVAIREELDIRLDPPYGHLHVELPLGWQHTSGVSRLVLVDGGGQVLPLVWLRSSWFLGASGGDAGTLIPPPLAPGRWRLGLVTPGSAEVSSELASFELVGGRLTRLRLPNSNRGRTTTVGQ